MTKRILVTGADGFTGRYLSQSLATAGHEVHGLVRSPPAEPVAGATQLHCADFAQADDVARIVSQVRADRIVHLAAIAFVGHADIEAMYLTNVVGTRHLLEALSRLSSAPEHVLLASSANVYGNSTGGRLAESTPPAPANDYAVTKLSMEYVARLYADRLPITITRPFNYTGVGQADSFLLPKIISHARRRAPVLELGNLDVARDFSDVRTVVQAYQRLLDEPAAVGGTFNVCSGVAVSLSEVLEIVRRLSKHEFEVRVNPAFVRANEVKMLLGDRTRLDACIGPQPAIPLHETLQWMLDAA
jgi:GDP-6-deoxy-D-talose 4-dehydrogenase